MAPRLRKRIPQFGGDLVPDPPALRPLHNRVSEPRYQTQSV